MAVIKHTKKKKEYKENNDTLVTFGEEAYTMRKDDPRTEEAIKKSKKLKEKHINSALLSGEISVFEGLNLSDTREDNESFDMHDGEKKDYAAIGRLLRSRNRRAWRRGNPDRWPTWCV